MPADLDDEMQIIALFVVVTRNGDPRGREKKLDLLTMKHRKSIEATRHPAFVARRRRAIVGRGRNKGRNGGRLWCRDGLGTRNHQEAQKPANR
jgi:hypothetical protein